MMSTSEWNRRLRLHLPKVVAGVTVIVFVDRVFDLGFMSIDWIGVGLLMLIVFSPYVPQLQKFAVGDIEFELRDEIERVQEKVRKREQERTEETADEPEDLMEGVTPPESPFRGEFNEKKSNKIRRLERRFYSQIDDSPRGAISELRVWLDNRLEMIADVEGVDYNEDLLRTLLILEMKGVVSSELSTSIQEVLHLCKEALEAREVSKTDAKRIIDLGIDVASRLWEVYSQRAVTPVIDEIQISDEEREEYSNATYEVKTVKPLTEDPQILVREYNQRELDAFFEDYHSFAEFVIDIEKLSSENDR